MKIGSGKVHELSLMRNVFDMIEATLLNQVVTRVNIVRLGVGKLTNAESDALHFAFYFFIKGTVCEDAELVVEEIPIKARCKNCFNEFIIEQLLFECEMCHCRKIEIIEGEEIILKSLEVV